MGYESKFYAVKEYDFNSYNRTYHASTIIAMLDVSKMGYSDNIQRFLNLFDTEIPFGIYLPDGLTADGDEIMQYTQEDRYGAHIKYIRDIDKGIELMKEIKKEDNYYGFDMLLNFLKTFKKYDWIYICHYGY